jgi:hypothetical protein
VAKVDEWPFSVTGRLTLWPTVRRLEIHELTPIELFMQDIEFSLPSSTRRQRMSFAAQHYPVVKDVYRALSVDLWNRYTWGWGVIRDLRMLHEDLINQFIEKFKDSTIKGHQL